MKVWELQGQFRLESLKLVERPEPKPAHGQVIVCVRAVSLNFRDLLVATGKYNPRLKLPLVPCSDAAGEVVAVGEGVTRVKVGERVAGTFFQGWIDGSISEAKTRAALGGGIDGVLAEYVALSEDGVVTFPAHLSFEEAATLPCAALTAWNALVESHPIAPGRTVLTQGTGGVSLFAVQIAKLAGARVIVTSSRDEKLERAKALGADFGINYVSEPAWDDRVRELTGGSGADQIVELGGAGTLAKSFKAVRMGGMISLIGVLTGAGEVNPIPVLMKSIRLQGIFVGSRVMLENMNHAFSQHGIRPVIDRIFSMDEVPQGMQHLASGAHFGKIVIKV